MTAPADKIEDLAARRAARKGGKRCPICNAPAVAAFRPFCSRRCADIDLGRWLKEGYSIPTEETSDPEDQEPRREED